MADLLVPTLIHARVVFVDSGYVDLSNATLLDQGDRRVRAIRWPLHGVRGQHVALRLLLRLRLLNCDRVHGGLLHDLQSLNRRACLLVADEGGHLIRMVLHTLNTHLIC